MGNHVRSVGLPFGVDIDFLLQSIQVYVARDVLIVLDRNGSRIECISQGIFVLHPVSPYICAIVATCSETDGFDGGRFHLLLRHDSFVNRTVQVQGDV